MENVNMTFISNMLQINSCTVNEYKIAGSICLKIIYKYIQIYLLYQHSTLATKMLSNKNTYNPSMNKTEINDFVI